jgi:SSS family solute:Na+ symporter
MAVCVVFTGYAVLTSTEINDKLMLDMGKMNFTHHKYMLGVYSHLVLFGVGYLACLFFKRPDIDKKLTYYGWSKMKRREKGDTRV